MNKKKSIQADRRSLRKRAEDQLSSDRVTDVSNMSTEEVKKLVLELETHQIELKMQNEELRLAQEELYDSHAEYVQLYDFAPVGYLTINHKNIITHINLTMAALLGKQRARIINNPLSSYIFNEDQDTYYLNIKKTKETQNKQHCELRLVTKDNDTIWVHLEFQPEDTHEGREKVILIAVIDITERKQVQKEIIAAKEFAENLLETANTMVVTFDSKACITSFNKYAENLTEYKRTEVMGQNWFDIFIPQDDKKTISKVFNKVLKRKLEVYQYENPIVTKNGEIKLISWNNNILKDSKENIVGVLSIGMDITEQKKYEEEIKTINRELENSMALADSIYNAIPDAIVTVDTDRKIVSINKSFQKILGYSQAEILGRTTAYFYESEAEFERMGKLRYNMTAEEQAEPYEVNYRRKNGEVFSGETLGVPILNKLGERIGFIGVIRDITDRKQSEEALRESEEQYRLIVENANDGIEIVQNDRLIYFNSRFAEMLGYTTDEIKNMIFSDYFTEQAIHSLQEREKRRKSNLLVPTFYETTFRKKDGTIIDVDVKYEVIKYKGIPAVFTIIRDITERKLIEEQREHALKEAQNANRVKTLFMANMSHEIRTPLNAIMGFSDLLYERVGHLVGDEEKEFFNTIRNSGNRLIRTVHQILDISQIEAGSYTLKVEQINLFKLVKELMSEYQFAAKEKNLKITFNSVLKSAYIQADEFGLTLAISNLIDNAIKYTEQGEINILLEQKSDQYLLTIRDTGIGIAEEYMDGLFEVFSQESEGYTKKFQGIGLGMAIAKSHLDLNKVGIQVESTKGVGATFTLTFKPVKKRVPEKQVEEVVAKETPAPEPIEQPLLLVVEDDPNSKNLVKYFLKNTYDLQFAVSVTEAKQQMKKYPVDLILLDLSLVGNEDGLDLVRWMRKTKTWENTPVIATTAHAFTTDRDNCLAVGCNDYLSKPIKREKLLEKIREFV